MKKKKVDMEPEGKDPDVDELGSKDTYEQAQRNQIFRDYKRPDMTSRNDL